MDLRHFLFYLLLFINFPSFSQEKRAIHNFKLTAPEYLIGDEFAEIVIEALNEQGIRDSSVTGNHSIMVNSSTQIIQFFNGIGYYAYPVSTSTEVEFKLPESPEINKSIKIKILPSWLSTLPAIMAIVLSLIFRDVIISIFISIYAAVILLTGFRLNNLITALLRVIDHYIFKVLKDEKHLSLIFFILFTAGMISIISRNGGIFGLIHRISKLAHSARSAQLLTFIFSILLFFDNYTNTLVVGKTMKSITERFKVSREKLAFIVHGTAATISSVALVTTWIGAKLIYISDAATYLNIADSAFSIFYKSLQYSHYQFLMLGFIVLIIIKRKDFDTMAAAEVSSRSSGIMNRNKDIQIERGENYSALEPEHENLSKWYNAGIPLISIIIIAIITMLYTGSINLYKKLSMAGVLTKGYKFNYLWNKIDSGYGNSLNAFQKFGVIIGHADFYRALLWSSFSGIAFAIFLTIIQRKIEIRKSMNLMLEGFNLMLRPIIILIFSWALAEVIKDLRTAEFITSEISGNIKPHLIPLVSFLLAALFTFASGSVWGTMAILYPLFIPVSWFLSQSAGLNQEECLEILYNLIAFILSGAVFGIHCSPISDTSLLTAIACDCNHSAHLKTQIPYAALIAGLTIIMGLISLTGLHWSLNYLLAIVLMYTTIHFSGKKIE
ncbi:MAG: Na+/H+ antiporter NhaC family protein [Cytophagaceae bacterium]